MADGDSQYSSDQLRAQENWDRYEYGRDRGHDRYCQIAKRLEDFVLGGGAQWAPEDKAAVEASGRLALEFNEILPAIKVAAGYQIANRMDIAFRPRGGSATQEIANILSKVAMQVADNVGLHHKETDQFIDGMIQRRGYLSFRVDFDDSMRGEIRIDVEDPMDVIPDPDAKGYDPDTWSDRIITRWLTLDEIEQRYGKDAREAAELGASGIRVSADLLGDTDFGDDENSGESRNKFGNRNSGISDAIRQDKRTIRLRIVDRQWFVYEMSRVLVSPHTGDVIVAEALDPMKKAAMLEQGWVPSKRMAKRVKWRVSSWDAVLHDDYSPYPWLDLIPFFPIFRRGESRGMVDNATGPQEALNKLASQFIHIINTTANSGWKVKENALTNMDTEDLEDHGAKAGLVLELKNLDDAEKIQPNTVPTGVDRMMQILMGVLKENTAPDAMRGIEGGEKSGIAIQSRQFAAQQQLAMELDNLGRSRLILAKRILWGIQNYMDDQRLFRITKPNPQTGEPEEEQLEVNTWDEATNSILNDLSLGEYEAIVSETPVQVTFENGQFEQGMRMREAGIAIPDDVLIRTSALAEKNELVRRMAKQGEKPDPLTEAEIRLKDAQTRKANAEATSKKVETIFSGVQTGQAIAMNPAIAPLSDIVLRSGGFEDEDAAPIVPSVVGDIAALPPEQNTNPLTPANPAVGMNAGIEGGGP